jgi:hypothetical protein
MLWHSIPLGVLAWTAGFVAIFATVLATIQVPSESKASVRFAFGWEFGIYLAVLFLGNSITAIALGLAIFNHDSKLPIFGNWDSSAPDWTNPLDGLLIAVAGIFGFHAILNHVKLSLFKLELSIETWIAKALDLAAAAALRRQQNHTQLRVQRIAAGLTQLKAEQLQAFVLHQLGEAGLKQVESLAHAAMAEEKVYKALTVATAKPDESEAFLQTFK